MALVASLLAGCGDSGPAEDATQADASCETSYPATYMVIDGTVLNMLARVAVAEGFFSANCLEASPVSLASVPDGIKQLVTNDLDFALVAPDNVFQARSEGIEVQFVANVLSRQLLSFVVRKQIADGKTLEEALPAVKKIGVPALGGSNELMARAAITDAGGDPDAVTFVALGVPTAMLAGLKNGTVDALMAYGTSQDIAAAEGYGIILEDLRKPGDAQNPSSPTIEAMNGSVVLYAASERQIAESPEKVRAFQEAMKQAAEWVEDPANFDALKDVMSADAAVPDSVPNADQVYSDSIELFASLVNPTIDVDSLDSALAFTKKTRGLEYDEPVDDTIWLGDQ